MVFVFGGVDGSRCERKHLANLKDRVEKPISLIFRFVRAYCCGDALLFVVNPFG